MTRYNFFAMAIVLIFGFGVPCSGFAATSVDGVFGFADDGGPLLVSIWVPLGEGESVSEISWFNNDEDVVFSSVRLMAGSPSRLGAISSSVVIAEQISGVSSGWSTLPLPQPVATTEAGIYAVFEIPAGNGFSREGGGGGAGFGYWQGDGLRRAWISDEGNSWSPISEECQVAVVADRSFEKAGNVLVLTMNHKLENGSKTLAGDPTNSVLVSAYPNPFNPQISIGYSVPRDSRVSVGIYDLRGRLVRLLVDTLLPAGEYTETWNGKSDQEMTVASGVYLVRTQVDSRSVLNRITLLR